jgi:hypothetical protein
LTGEPVTKYLPLIPTVPVIFIAANACFVGTTSNAKVVRTIPINLWKRETGLGLRSVKSGVTRSIENPPKKRAGTWLPGRLFSVRRSLAVTPEARIGFCSAVGSGAGAVARRLLLGMYPRFPSSCPVRNCRGSVSSTRHIARSARGFPALRAPAYFASRVMGPDRVGRLQSQNIDTRRCTPRRALARRTSIPCSTASTPKPRRWHALARWRRIFISTQFRMNDKHRLE